MRTTGLAAAAIAAGLLLSACGKDAENKAPAPAAPGGGETTPAAPGAQGTEPKPAAPSAPAEQANSAGIPDEAALLAKYGKDLQLPMVKYEWDRNAGDKSVPAELGGPGFTGEGWETKLEFPTTAWPDAPKGGTLRTVMYDWPSTLRICGENHNSTFNSMVENLCLDYLLAFNVVTMEYNPSLATHWKISPDKATYTFRINPEARWSDGNEITAQDVIATWKLRMDTKARYPGDQVVFSKFDEPVARSKYIVEVHCNQENWRNFLYFATGMPILPAREISIPGDEYLDKFQNSFHAMSGAYIVKIEDVKMGQSVTLTRRTDWWGEKNPANRGAANLDKIIMEVVKDPGLAYEKVKKGDLDYFPVPKAQWWAEEIPKLDSVQRGLLVMRKFFNDCPIGTNGIACNMKRAPLDDLRIRKALQLLMNRRLYIKKLYFDEYLPLTSYHQGGVYSNPANREIPYDPVAAVELLEQAGWTESNQELIRVKDGRPLKFEIIYDSQLSERFLTTYQDDCRKAGIQIDLKRMDSSEHFKTTQGKDFELSDQPWTGLFFPNPETSWLSELADKTDNNNITSFKDPRVDALCKEYDRSYDATRRAEIIREIDGIVYAAQPYVLMWFNPAQRAIFWNKFGMPAWGCARTARVDQAFYGFWVDPAKERALEEARRDSSKKLPLEEVKNYFWHAWNAANRKKAGGGGK